MSIIKPQIIGGNAPWVSLNNGEKMPSLGLGLHGLFGEELERAFCAAVQYGYRLFDGAANYRNGDALKDTIKSCGLQREELFITSKIRNKMHSYDDTLREFDYITEMMGVEYLDMLMIHFPCPKERKYLESWKAMERLYEQGCIRVLGVSNFDVMCLEDILNHCNTAPAVNQFECNPYITEEALRFYCEARNIVPQAYFPLGGPRDVEGFPAPEEVLLEDQVIKEIAEKYERNPAQIILRWEIQSGLSAVPKSKTPSRLKENISIFDFSLLEEDYDTIRRLNHNRRIGMDPITVEPYGVAHIE